MDKKLNNIALDTLFRNARSHNGWQDNDISDEQLNQIYDLFKMGPTSANSCPARILFIRTAEAKEKLKSCLQQGNIEKSITAPVVAAIAMDLKFYEQLPFLFPHTDAKSWFEGKIDKIRLTALRDSTLQGAYLMLAARSLGLDCGPMSGFDNKKFDALFFKGTNNESLFLCALGYGDESKLQPRGPRLDFAQVCKIL
jgi:3-hydroxypropanoate dehydrogenase